MRYGEVHFLDANGTVVAALSGVGLTESVYERTKGLLADTVSAQQGLFISPCNSVHTFGMRCPLDLVYIGRGQRVRKIVENMRPSRVSVSLPAKGVLELRAGRVRELGLKTGMTVRWIDND